MVDSRLHTPAPSDAPPPAAAPQPPRRRWLRALLWSWLVLAVLVSGLLGTAWWFSGRPGSLDYTLQRLAGWLPEGQSLQARDVTGTLRHGGHIGWLQWQSPTMQVQLHDASIGWQLRPLLARTLRLDEIRIAELHIASTPDPDDKTPVEPLQQLALPIRIDAPFQVERILWQGPSEAEVLGLGGRYAYDGTAHQLGVDRLRWADGSYQAQLRLQAHAPMAIQAELQGELQTPASGQADSPMPPSLAVKANARISGTLATAAARLQLQLKVDATPDSTDQAGAAALRPPKGPRRAAPPDPMQAEAQASIHPWQPQPLETARVQLRHIDIGAFWPQGPRTQLSGELQAGPAAQASPAQAAPPSTEPGAAIASTIWQLQARLRNGNPGPWDRQRLPVDSIDVSVRYDGQQWQLQQSQIEVGQGRISAEGRFAPASQLFEGQASIDRLDPAALYSTLEAAPLRGELSARATDQQQVEFAIGLQAAPAARAAKQATLRLQKLAARGRWAQPLLSLEELQIEALQASVRSRSLQLDTQQQKLQTVLQARLPGAELTLDGHISPAAGQGRSQLQLGSMTALTQWLRGLPGLKDPLAGALLEGQAQLDVRWQGGWGALHKRLQAGAGEPLPASGLQLQADLQADKLRYLPAGTAPEQALQLPTLKLALQGSPEQASITLAGQASRAGQNAQWDTRLQAGLATARGAAPLDWQASIAVLQASLSPGAGQAAPWQLKLAGSQPVQITQRSTGGSSPGRATSGRAATSTTYTVTSGSLQITAPTRTPPRSGAEPPTPALLAWDDTRATLGGDGRWLLRSTGRAQALPLAWVDALSMAEEPPLAAMGLSGDLSFNTRWDIDTTGGALKAEWLLDRAGGDLRLAVEDGQGTTVVRTTGPRADQPGEVRTRTVRGTGMRTHIRQARLRLLAQGDEVQARLDWDSERAGTVTAQLRTRLAMQDGSWSWPEKAPLSGQIDARMPDIGIWALFAPPGWRVTGSLQAQAEISGDRQNPQWQGRLSADGLSVLSTIDGVDLQDGMLRARLQGNRLDLTELRFKGGRGSSARIAGYSGNLTAAPREGGELTGSGFVLWQPPGPDGTSSGLSMDLQAKARQLQVLVRADRQVSISGDLQARLEQGQFTLRGNLATDRATIILPEESAPSLDSDVVVHSAASRKAQQEAERKRQQAENKAQARAQTRKPPDILVKLDLGRDFALQGYGITTRLEGALEVQGATVAGGAPRITGEIRTVQGRYRAWGQSLDVETGLIRFNGPYANPSLDILALRPNIAVRAGVQVQGTASSPRVRLYSDPELPDAEKLSWVAMGRDPATGGAESALLQQAALSLLSGGRSSGGKLASNLGLDEVGFKGPGEGGSGGAALTLGKRLSSDLYVTYEQSLSGAMGTIYIFYDLSRRLTLRGQTGETSAMDLIYTVRKD
ncbi:translocation/assembly module TamB domain-containing protein [Delftia sp. PS-11]|uniref:translocation/assembly module TamB domain-containing protein n=1 Tax=Delftia sp. PS-11 TaxID=2767222 RepID=UPI002457AF97|nr:translocation/assembly module TamB domain-containing protein [Delftia sp. PS-11]KAJ8746510.1 translocation/assembly module TamB domain-containing protein [Delftia sp. PS-11]